MQQTDAAGAGPDDIWSRTSVLDQARMENFPVASRLLPRRHRRDLRAVYWFARLVDDIGDEAPPEDRRRLLDLLEEDLGRVYQGVPRLPVTRALMPAVTSHAIPPEPFRALIQANRQDQEVHRYASFEDLLAYCHLSANPVGHIVLYLFDAATPERLRLSDRVCSALQIIEHCQDAGEDFGKGRIYLPEADRRTFGCTERDFAAGHVTPTHLRGLIAFEARRAGRLLEEGMPLVGMLHGFARIAVAGYVAGGRAALAALERAGYDVLARPSGPSRSRTATEWLRLLARKG